MLGRRAVLGAGRWAARLVIEGLGQLAHHLVAGGAQFAHDLASGAQQVGESLGAQDHQRDREHDDYFNDAQFESGGLFGGGILSYSPPQFGVSTMLTTALIADRRFTHHFAGRSHPDRPQRIEAMLAMADQLKRPNLKVLTPREATLGEIGLCHGADYITMVERTAALERYDFDPDTHTSRETFDTARLAAGGVLTAVEAVLDGAADNAFAIVRPPGHHALPERAMGFCFFNNVAIAARWLIRERGLRRVMIVDWDLHHGNGSQEIFYDSPEVLYTSLHQFPHYPGTGSLQERGDGAGAGFTVNIPMPATFGDAEYLRAFDELLMPIGRKFKPEFILVSAGFDCHFRDPLGAMQVTEAGFAAMARRAKRLAAECCNGKMAAALEGGYDLQALAASGEAVIEEFGRDADEPIAPAANGDRVMPIIDRIRRNLAPWWNLG
jgi:acetoin utilization deacetylase AcuC-like enzyme